MSEIFIVIKFGCHCGCDNLYRIMKVFEKEENAIKYKDESMELENRANWEIYKVKKYLID